MSLSIGYHGDQRPELFALVGETCKLLGGDLVLINEWSIPVCDILLWNFIRPLDKSIYDLLQNHHNVYFLPERERKNRVFSSIVHPQAFYEEYLVVPFDPEELALRIVKASYRRQQHLMYQFDPVFYAIYQELIDTHTFPPE